MNFQTYLGILWSFLLTVLIEGAVIFAIFRRKKYVYYSFLCNLLTNPALNLLLALAMTLLGARVYFPALLLAELAVVCVEAAVYKYICGFGAGKSVILSAVLNALSFAAGFLVNWSGFLYSRGA